LSLLSITLIIANSLNSLNIITLVLNYGISPYIICLSDVIRISYKPASGNHPKEHAKLNPAQLKRQISKLQNKLIKLSSAKAKK